MIALTGEAVHQMSHYLIPNPFYPSRIVISIFIFGKQANRQIIADTEIFRIRIAIFVFIEAMIIIYYLSL